MAKRSPRTDRPENHDRFVGCDNPGDLQRAEALLYELVKNIARQLAREDHLAEKEKAEKEKQ
jgi:hypothetical protein